MGVAGGRGSAAGFVVSALWSVFALFAVSVVVLAAASSPLQAPGAACSQSGNPDEWIAACSRLLQQRALPFHRQVKAHFRLGAGYALKGDHDRAVTEFDKVLALDPRDTDAYVERALSLEALGERGRAIADFTAALADAEAALAARPNDAEAHFARGRAFSLIGHHDRAVADLARALALDARLADRFAFRGVRFASHAGRDRFIADLFRAIALNARREVGTFLERVTAPPRRAEAKGPAD